MSFQASRHSERAARGDLDATAIAVATHVAGAWYDIVLTRARRALLREQVDATRALLELVELRYDGAAATGLDVLQQRQQLAATEALLPALEYGVQRAELRLAVLLGENPTAFSQRLDAGDTLPELPASPGLGEPADLLVNRPDVAAAVSRVDAAHYNKIAAQLTALPTLAVNANAGWQYFRQDDLNSADVWGVGASLSVPLFNGGRTWAGMKSARAGQDAAAAQARRAVLTAIQEVEDANLAERQATEERAAATTQVAAAKLAWENARDRYVNGLVTLTTVLQTLTAYQNAQLSLLQAHRNQLGARIALHDALGGRWARGITVGGSR